MADLPCRAAHRRPLAGAMAAVLIAVSPPMLYQVVQPMNDVTTAALWMATFVALVGCRWTVAGVCCGLALMVRPNLLPLGAMRRVLRCHQSQRERRAESGCAVSGGGASVWFDRSVAQQRALRQGHSEPNRHGQLVCSASFGIFHSTPRYLWWLIETATPFPLLAFAAPFSSRARQAW